MAVSEHNTEIAKRGSNAADEKNGSYITWNPTGTTSAPDENGSTQRPPFIGLAHEMAHVKDVWDGTINRKIWQIVSSPDGKSVEISNSEKYSTHIENQIRAENKISLRAYYSVDENGNGNHNTRLIKAGTRQSLYYNSNGETNYRKLNKKIIPFTY
ncbi:M91 family zinc metallopeptidase [Chitinophaga sp. RCC_12]|uniref:M91 family zinc metallopeptidase n=1 Tax=Chitinophaga sp. RCC_12 TaxID=3239226 RepID=UPI00352617FF